MFQRLSSLRMIRPVCGSESNLRVLHPVCCLGGFLSCKEGAWKSWRWSWHRSQNGGPIPQPRLEPRDVTGRRRLVRTKAQRRCKEGRKTGSRQVSQSRCHCLEHKTPSILSTRADGSEELGNCLFCPSSTRSFLPAAVQSPAVSFVVWSKGGRNTRHHGRVSNSRTRAPCRAVQSATSATTPRSVLCLLGLRTTIVDAGCQGFLPVPSALPQKAVHHWKFDIVFFTFRRKVIELLGSFRVARIWSHRTIPQSIRSPQKVGRSVLVVCVCVYVSALIIDPNGVVVAFDRSVCVCNCYKEGKNQPRVSTRRYDVLENVLAAVVVTDSWNSGDFD